LVYLKLWFKTGV